MSRNRWLALCLAGCLLLALCACGNQDESGGSGPNETADSDQGGITSQEEQETLAEYMVDGLGTFQLPEGFQQDAGSIAEPPPMKYATFEKDAYYIQANRFGADAYEISGASLPADLEEYATRQGVKDSVPEGTVFAYDDYGNYAAQFTQEDGQICYYVLLQGEDSFGSIFLTAPEDLFDAETAALWLSGSQLK